VPVDPGADLPGTYDLVVALGSLTGVRRKREILARIDAALIDGGRMLLADHLCTLRGDLDDRAAGVMVPTLQSWVTLLGSARLVIDEAVAPPAALGELLDQPGLAEPRRRGWSRPVLLRLRKDVAVPGDDRDRNNQRVLAGWAAE
jgi:polyketide synthase 12